METGTTWVGFMCELQVLMLTSQLMPNTQT